ncbi:hypothetical protein [Actinomadura nitritigenes]|uniref:phage tail tube protein n=1 Tax=Actinomadura nitritigenes TaxID=134602 RepID=UPI003D8D7476
MTATNIAAAERFFAPSITRIIFVASVSDITAVTRTEINSGTDLSNEIVEIDGWAVNANLLDAPDLGHRFTGKVSGRTEADNSSITMYQSKTTDDARRLIPRGTTGNVLILWGGDVAGRYMDVYPVECASVGKTLADNKASDMKFTFAITSEPAEDVEIPA